ncbi:MAG: hypothetical protein ACTSU6_03255 [Candidatus Njordarchaeales archaeon]
MTLFEAYLLTRLDSIHGLFIAASVLSGGVTFVSIIASAEHNKRYMWKGTAGIAIIFMTLLSVTLLIPSKKDIAFIYSAKILTDNKIPSKALDIINKYLDKLKDEEK